MTKEQKYAAEMKRLGIYDPAFDQTIHQLAMLEREQSRTRKAWKIAMERELAGEEGKDPDRIYAVILQQDKLIHTLRDSLGMTPKGLKRFRGSFGSEEDEQEERPKTPLELLMEKRRAVG